MKNYRDIWAIRQCMTIFVKYIYDIHISTSGSGEIDIERNELLNKLPANVAANKIKKSVFTQQKI